MRLENYWKRKSILLASVALSSFFYSSYLKANQNSDKINSYGPLDREKALLNQNKSVLELKRQDPYSLEESYNKKPNNIMDSQSKGAHQIEQDKEAHYGFCDNTTVSPGTVCIFEIKNLAPTQPVIGKEIVADIGYLLKRKKKVSVNYFVSYLKTQQVPIVIGPKGKAYLINYHNFVYALQSQGEHYLFGKVLENFSKLNATTFWQVMEARSWVYTALAGKLKVEPEDLPPSISEIPDDIFRSVSYYLWKRGLYCSDREEPFTQFYWMNFLKRSISLMEKSAELKNPKAEEKLELKLKGFDALYAEAVILSKSKKAQNLPGFIGTSHCSEKNGVDIDFTYQLIGSQLYSKSKNDSFGAMPH